jgi:hypothetical protein
MDVSDRVFVLELRNLLIQSPYDKKHNVLFLTRLIICRIEAKNNIALDIA